MIRLTSRTARRWHALTSASRNILTGNGSTGIALMTTWTRVSSGANAFVKGNSTLATISNGRTLLRVHAGTLARMRTSVEEDPSQAGNISLTVGIYSVLQTGGTTLYPLDNPSDFAPPTQRWLHWRTLYWAPTPHGGGNYGAYQEYYSTSGPDLIDIEAQVKAASGALNIVFAWQPGGTFKGDWFPQIQWWASCLSS